MLKKILASSCLIGVSSVCLGSGFYIGAGLGPEMAEFREDASVSQPMSFFVKNQDYKSGRGLFGTLYAGYGQYFMNPFSDCENIYLGVEINGDISGAEAETYNKEFVHQSFSHTHLKIKNSYGIGIMPGFLLTESTTFITRLGYTRGDFELNTSDTSLRKKHTTLSGFRYGWGIAQELSEHWNIRVEYSDVAYKSESGFAVDPLSTTFKKTIISPQTSKVEFSLTYFI